MEKFITKNRIRISFIIFLLLIVKDIIVHLRVRNLLTFTDFWGIPILLMILAGIFLRSWAAGVIKKDDALATDGPYSMFRHPLYIGSFLMACGFCIILWDNIKIWVVLLVFILIYLPKINQEEKMLKEKFGSQWDEYKKNTGKFLIKNLKLSKCQWSIKQWIRNREYNAFFTGIAAVIILEIISFLQDK